MGLERAALSIRPKGCDKGNKLMVQHNTFTNLLRTHLRDSVAGTFGKFDYAVKAGTYPIKPGHFADFLLEIRVDDGSPDGRSWVVGDSLPLATDYTSQFSLSTRGKSTPSIVAGEFSAVDGSVEKPHGATQADPTSNVISLSEQSGPPGNEPAASLDVDITFTVVAAGDSFFFLNRESIADQPMLWIEVVNNSTTHKLDSFFFNGGTGFSAGGSKIMICHVPPGNPQNPRTIGISFNALPAHLTHGDTIGPCAVGGFAASADADGGSEFRLLSDWRFSEAL